MTSQRLEVLALLYEHFGSDVFPFKGVRGSACQMLYSFYAQNPYRNLLGLQTDDAGTNFKGEYVLDRLINTTNFITFVKKEQHFDKTIVYYKLSDIGATVGRLLATKELENITLAKQTTKKYIGEAEELPIIFYKSEIDKKDERIYFLEQKIKEFKEFVRMLKNSQLHIVAQDISDKIKEYKV